MRTGALHALAALSVAGVSPCGRRAGRLGLAVARVEGEALFQNATARARLLVDGIARVVLAFRLPKLRRVHILLRYDKPIHLLLTMNWL